MRLNKNIAMIQKIVNHIEDNLSEGITVAQMASLSEVSSWQFQRIFRSIIGDSLGNYIRHRRLTKAAERLKNSDQRIIDIALEFEFNSQEAFTRSFKSYFNATPQQVRKNEVSIITKNKPVITPSFLDFLNGGIALTPKIITRETTKLIGMKSILTNVFSKYQNFNETILPFWLDFAKRIPEIQNKLHNDKTCIGLLKNDNTGLSDDDFYYLAAVEVENFNHVPEGMVTYEIPRQTYAVFVNQGLGDKSSFTINYIYGTWLPQSKFTHAQADDFEYFDERYSIENEDSISEYYLPLDFDPDKA